MMHANFTYYTELVLANGRSAAIRD